MTRPATLSTAQLARRLGCSRSTIQRARDRGDITPRSDGRFPASAVETLRALRAAEAEAARELAKVKSELLEAKRDKERAVAQLRQLEAGHAEGKFVELKVVQDDAAGVAERILAVLRSIPQRTALALEAALVEAPAVRAAKIAHLVSNEIERSIGELHESMFVGAEIVTDENGIVRVKPAPDVAIAPATATTRPRRSKGKS